eukprot:364462-Chlamydomonas_euryale.AAC.6
MHAPAGVDSYEPQTAGASHTWLRGAQRANDVQQYAISPPTCPPRLHTHHTQRACPFCILFVRAQLRLVAASSNVSPASSHPLSSRPFVPSTPALPAPREGSFSGCALPSSCPCQPSRPPAPPPRLPLVARACRCCRRERRPPVAATAAAALAAALAWLSHGQSPRRRLRRLAALRPHRRAMRMLASATRAWRARRS